MVVCLCFIFLAAAMLRVSSCSKTASSLPLTLVSTPLPRHCSYRDRPSDPALHTRGTRTEHTHTHTHTYTHTHERTNARRQDEHAIAAQGRASACAHARVITRTHHYRKTKARQVYRYAEQTGVAAAWVIVAGAQAAEAAQAQGVASTALQHAIRTSSSSSRISSSTTTTTTTPSTVHYHSQHWYLF